MIKNKLLSKNELKNATMEEAARKRSALVASITTMQPSNELCPSISKLCLDMPKDVGLGCWGRKPNEVGLPSFDGFAQRHWVT